MGWTAPRTFVTGEVETAAIFNAHLRDNLLFLKSGVATTSLVTSNQGPTLGTTELVVASGTLTTDGSTLVEISFSWYNINKTVAGDSFDVYLYDGATPGSGTQIAHWIADGGSSSSTVLGSGLVRTVITPTAASHTYTARLVRSAGTGTGTLSAGSANVAVLNVRQVG